MSRRRELTEAEVVDIRRALAVRPPETTHHLWDARVAESFGIGATTVQRIRLGYIYTHFPLRSLKQARQEALILAYRPRILRWLGRPENTQNAEAVE